MGKVKDVPQQGLITHLKGFRTVYILGHVGDYVMCLADREKSGRISRE
ncbi:hypothetical protein [Pontibacter harenae]|nr:hypothetical protein [Pontibacter harenae]MCC9168538.1 hypothetical protein [Pontibacter harenae]